MPAPSFPSFWEALSKCDSPGCGRQPEGVPTRSRRRAGYAMSRSLESHLDAYLRTASCNRAEGGGWCRSCAKCAWVFLATSALFGRDLAVRKAGGDMFAGPALSGLYEAMAGLAGDKPFECTGTEEEVRSAIAAAGQHGGDVSALASCLRDPAVMAARPLGVLLKDWGQDCRFSPHFASSTPPTWPDSGCLTGLPSASFSSICRFLLPAAGPPSGVAGHCGRIRRGWCQAGLRWRRAVSGPRAPRGGRSRGRPIR
jgi:hypothetical protein